MSDKMPEPLAGISPTQLDRLKSLIKDGSEGLFYDWRAWRRVRRYVLRDLDNKECQRCKTLYRRYRKAEIVHHVKHLQDRPDLALSIWDGEERQLISVCRKCHKELHPERFGCIHEAKPKLTEERWD